MVVESVASDEQHVQLRVRDTGLGMTPEQVAGLFQPYNRLGREQSGIDLGAAVREAFVGVLRGELQHLLAGQAERLSEGGRRKLRGNQGDDGKTHSRCPH